MIGLWADTSYYQRRDSFYQPIFAHTSPVWARSRPSGRSAFRLGCVFRQRPGRRHGLGKFNTPRQQAEVLDLFRAGQEAYRKCL